MTYTVVNTRDKQIIPASPRLLGVTMADNIEVSQSNVTGLGIIVEGTKQVYFGSTSQIFQIAKSGSVSPSSITLTANVKNITGTPTLTIAPGGGTMSVTPTLTSGSFTFTASQMTTDTVTFLLSLTDGATTYTDTVTVVKAREGIDSVVGYLTNEATTFPADYLGNVLSYATGSGQFKVFQGSNDVTSACTFSVPAGGNPSSLTYSLTATGASAGQYSVTAGYPSGTNVTSLTIRATFGTITLDKIFVISKSKAGANGSNGTNGTNGVDGTRGSMTFYVAVAATSWSDSTANTAVAAQGGAVINDLVVQYNNSAGFSQSRFWNGTAWVVVNAVVDGNLLVNGTVGAKSLTINSGTGNNLLADRNYADTSAWLVASWGTLPTQATVTDGVSGSTVMRSPTGSQASARGAWRVPVTVGKQYRISARVRKSSTANGKLSIRLDKGTTPTGAYSEVKIGIENVTTVPTSWTEYSSTWTATYPFISVMVLLNNTGTVGYMEAQDIRIEELTDSALIVAGGITADRIDSRGLSIKDASGNVVFSAGTGVDYSLVNKAPQSGGNIVYCSDFSSNIGSWQGTRESVSGQTWAWAIGSQSRDCSEPSAILSVTPGEVFYAEADILPNGAQISVFGLAFKNSAGTDISWLGAPSSSTASWQHVSGVITVPAGAAFAVPWFQINGLGTLAKAYMANPYIGRAQKGATVGATFGVNISGQINSGNASTYIADAAIGNAQMGTASIKLANIDTATITNLQALSATIGVLRTATSGQRTEIQDNKILVYDSSNVIRVKIGNLA